MNTAKNDELLNVVQKFHANPNNAVKKYPWFPKQYPRLYQMCTSPTFDMNMFKKILNAKEKMNKSEISEHDASVEVGQLLVDKYVKPLVT